MAAFNKFNAFVEAVAEKKHNLGADQIAVALTNSLPATSAEVIGDIAQISYASCSSRNLTRVSSAQISGVYRLVVADTVLTASGGSVGPFRYIVVYNATSGDLIGFYDYGTSATILAGESFPLDFNDTLGILSLA